MIQLRASFMRTSIHSCEPLTLSVCGKRLQDAAHDGRAASRASDMPHHVRGIVETDEQARGANRQVLHDDELLVSKKPDAKNAVLNSCKASRDALALDRSKRHSTPDSQMAGPANRPEIDA